VKRMQGVFRCWWSRRATCREDIHNTFSPHSGTVFFELTGSAMFPEAKVKREVQMFAGMRVSGFWRWVGLCILGWALFAPVYAVAQVTPFSFPPQTNVAPSTQITSSSVQVTSTAAQQSISIVGGEYRIGNGAFTSAAGVVNSCQMVQVRVLSASSFGTTTSATLNIGGTTGTFSVTTVAADNVPDPFSFAPQSGVGLSSQVTSNPITVTGTNTGAAISVTGGQYSINGGAYTATSGSVAPGSTVRVQLTSAPTSATSRQAVLTIGGVSATFRVTTLTVTSALDVSPQMLNFFEPALAISSVSGARAVTLTNNGGTPVAINGVGIGGPGSADFSQTNNCGTSLAAGASCTVSVTFRPSAKGVRVGEISIATNLSVGPGAITMVANRGAGTFVDFNGNGREDILWRHGADGADNIWLMDGAGRVTAGPDGGPIDTVPDLNWRVVGRGDFNGDGKTDILWRHAASGSNSIWLMDGASRIGGGPITARTSAAWQVAGIGDFNADGRADILWRNSSSGANGIWLMNGLTRTGNLTITAVPDLAWQIAGVADFNADGRSDILWRHGINGDNSIWLMDGGTRVGGGPITAVPEVTWQIAGVGDFNGDGKADILWRHGAYGSNSIWLMDGTTRLGGGPTLAVPELTWTVEQVADFDADGKADILWRHGASGSNGIWLMNGSTRIGGGPIDAVPDVGWSVVP